MHRHISKHKWNKQVKTLTYFQLGSNLYLEWTTYIHNAFQAYQVGFQGQNVLLPQSLGSTGQGPLWYMTDRHHNLCCLSKTLQNKFYKVSARKKAADYYQYSLLLINIYKYYTQKIKKACINFYHVFGSTTSFAGRYKGTPCDFCCCDENSRKKINGKRNEGIRDRGGT